MLAAGNRPPHPAGAFEIDLGEGQPRTEHRQRLLLAVLAEQGAGVVADQDASGSW